MPKITDLQIQKNNKTRANVYIDGEFAFALEMITVMKLGLKIGDEVSESKLLQAVTDSERACAFDKAMSYLGRGMKTVHQMREYLLRKGYDADVTEYVIAKLKDYRYLDDKAYASAYVEQNSATKGERRLRRELVSKGIAQTTAEQYAKEEGEQALAHAEQLARKYMKSKSCDVKNLQRLQRYLLSRGYDFDIVNAVVRSFNVTTDD